MRLCLTTYRLALIASLLVSALAITATDVGAQTAQELQTRCDRRDAVACQELGFYYQYGLMFLSQDHRKAFELYTKACNGGNVEGCFSVGQYLSEGIGVRQDKIRAAAFYTKACDGGSALGCFNLGVMYDNGEGFRQDKFKAVEFYTKACDGGGAEGCFNLAIMYERGEGVRQSTSRAKEFFGKACDLRYEGGCKEYARRNR